jgi:periplasmic copper chaperone A
MTFPLSWQNAVRLAAFAGLIVFASAVGATEFKTKDLVIERPHAMATAPGQPHGSIFFQTITNTGKTPEQLIGARAQVSKTIEIHRMDIENNIMKMREIPAIDIPANAKVPMGRGSKEGYHLMLMNLNAPLKEGETFPVTLVFRAAGEVQVTVTVEKPSMSKHSGHKH